MAAKLIETIPCDGDDGQSYVVNVYQDVIRAPSMGNPNQTIPGMKSLRLSDGRPLNFKDSDTFQTVDDTLILRRRGS